MLKIGFILPLLVLTSLLSAYTIYVPSDYANIQDAITAAQDGDTVLVSAGSYVGGFSFQGKNIVLKSVSGAGSTYLKSPFSDYHCVSFTGGEDSSAVLDGFSITNWGSDSEVPIGRSEIDGGGIYIINSSPTIRNNIIYGCYVSYSGSGIYIQNSSACFSSNSIIDNYAHGTGGAICAYGGGSSGPLQIIDCIIDGNTSSTTGGLHVDHSFVEIISNTITSNQGAAGGIWTHSPSLLVYSNVISGNQASNGGGIIIVGGYTTMTGNLISDNVAGHGGGVYEASSGTLCFENNTIAYNRADSLEGWGGGICAAKDTLIILNSILWGNIGGKGSQIGLPAAINESFTSVSYCDVMFGEDSVITDPQATLSWGPGNIDTDPLFETGPFGDHHLSLGSPCIDTGNPDPQYNDPEDPFNPGYALWPAMGTVRNDMGAFGGGAISYWLSIEEEEEDPSPSPGNGIILTAYPNPFSSSCVVGFQLEQQAHAVLQVFDLSGRLVDDLMDSECVSGYHSAVFDAAGLSSGVYMIRLVAGEQAVTRRCVVVR